MFAFSRGVAVVAVLAALLTTAVASAKPDLDKGPHFTTIEKKYLKVYPQAKHRFGYSTVGRNIVRTGFTNKKVATQQQISESYNRMVGWLNPPAPAPVQPQQVVAQASSSQTTSTPAQATGASTTAPASSGSCGGVTPYSGGGQCWAIPYNIVQCESGGNYGAHNPSGASGAYQLMVGGGGSKAQQDQNAAKLYAGGAGRSNWVC